MVEAHPEAAGARRLVILQFWRNLGPAKMDLPLAFCDARTVPKSEVRAFPVSNYAGNGGHQPMGTHAWFKSDMDFWRQHLPGPLPI